MLIASLLTVLDSLQSNQRGSGNQGKYFLVFSNVPAYTVKYSTSILSGPAVLRCITPIELFSYLAM